MRRRLLPPFVVSALVLASASPAAAVEPGVHVDPNSPAAKEYAIPLQAARSDSTGGSHSTTASRFGAGIEPGPSGASSGQSGSAGSRGSAKTPDKSKSHKLRLGDETQPGISRAAASAAGDGDSMALKLGGIALAVVVVASLLALGLRRGLRRGV
jgi:hypothetical protein